MNTTVSHPSTTGMDKIRPHILPLMAILVGLAAMVIYFAMRGSLWEDELIALTHTFQPLPTFFVEILRNDIHPFFYFLVLKGWMLLSPGSSSWALANSFAATLLSAVVVYRVGRAISGTSAALWATAIFVLLPTTVWGAANLRMYGLMPAMLVGVWYLNVRFLQHPSRWGGVALVLLGICTAYVHAIAFIFVFFIVVAVAIEQFKAVSRTTFRNWFLLQVVAGMAMLPLPGIALMRGTEPLPASSWDSLLMILGQTVAGNGGGPYRGILMWAGLVVFLSLLYFALQSKRWRVPVLVIPVGVLMAVYIIGFLGKPIFKSPPFSAALLPFLALGAGAGIAQIMTLPRRLPAAFAATFIVALAAVTIPWSGKLLSFGSYEAAAAEVKKNAVAGDVVIIPHLSVYWGVLFFAEGADWGLPLEVRAPDNPQWRKVTDKLGPELAATLSLLPKTQFVEFNGIRYCIGTDVVACASGARRAWVVDRRSYNNGVEFGHPMAPRKSVYINELVVTELASSEQGQKRFDNPFLSERAVKGQETSY
jgi:uncharacterized membrane protein